MKFLLLVMIFTPDGAVTGVEPFATEHACEAKAAQIRATLTVPHPFTTLCIDLTGAAA